MLFTLLMDTERLSFQLGHYSFGIPFECFYINYKS